MYIIECNYIKPILLKVSQMCAETTLGKDALDMHAAIKVLYIMKIINIIILVVLWVLEFKLEERC